MASRPVMPPSNAARPIMPAEILKASQKVEKPPPLEAQPTAADVIAEPAAMTLEEKQAAALYNSQKQVKKNMHMIQFEKFMRDQMLGVYTTPVEDLITTTEHKRRARSAKEKEEAAMADQEAAERTRAKEIKETKIETVKKYMEYMNRQSLKKAEAAKTAPKASAKPPTKAVKTVAIVEPEPEPVRSPESQWRGRPKGRESVMSASPATYGYGSFVDRDRTRFQEELGEDDYEIKPKGRIPSWTFFDQFGEDDGGIHVDVGFEAKDRVTPRTPNGGFPKMYNVSLGVRPRDLSRVYKTKPWDFHHPKKYDVSIGVGPGLGSLALSASEIMRRRKEEEMLGEQQPVLLPEYEMTAEEIEAERLRLLPKPSKRWEAGTLARPTGYRDLLLSIPQDALSFEHSTQVKDFDIERTMAAKRGIFLTEGNILWPTIQEFNTELGRRKIEDFIVRHWKLDKEWMFHIFFLQSHNTNYRRKYIFEVQFSTPTMLAPVPPATASVFFVIEILHYANLDDVVKVHYCLEGTRFAQIPGHLPFNQKWLQGIIADKLRVQRAMDF